AAADCARLRRHAARRTADRGGGRRDGVDLPRRRTRVWPCTSAETRTGDANTVTVSIRRATAGDVHFLVELVRHEDVEPFLGAVSAKDWDAVAEEVERSIREPHDFGRFVIEVDGERAGGMGFER